MGWEITQTLYVQALNKTEVFWPAPGMELGSLELCGYLWQTEVRRKEVKHGRIQSQDQGHCAVTSSSQR